ncbi:MAG: LCP family protein [Lachnospiraceae bacterium]|nr:LCP family protein [Lachnospiraceae bacterium]
MSDRETRQPSRRQKRRKRRKVLLIIEIIILVLLLLVLFAWLKFGTINVRNIGKVKTGNISKKTEKVLSGYTNFMVYGVDNRTAGNYNGGNTDVQILVSINNDTKKIRMASVYRDLYLDVDPTNGTRLAKSNAAYARGGEKEAMEMINENFDLNVDKFVTVDFAAVVDIIDDVGGIEVDVSDDELAALNSRRYPTIPQVARISGKKATYVTKAGPQTLNGVQACAYCRIRHGAGDDWGRARRQRMVMSQLFKKVKGASASQMSKIIDDVFPKISTNFSMTEMLSLASAVKSYSIDKSFGFPFDETNMALNGRDTMIPCTLESNVEKLHQKMFDEANYAPSQTVRAISDQIVQVTGKTEESAQDYSKIEGNIGVDDSNTSDTSETDTPKS